MKQILFGPCCQLAQTAAWKTRMAGQHMKCRGQTRLNRCTGRCYFRLLHIPSKTNTCISMFSFHVHAALLVFWSGLPWSGKNIWNMKFFQAWQGKVREFCGWPGKFRKDFESHTCDISRFWWELLIWSLSFQSPSRETISPNERFFQCFFFLQPYFCPNILSFTAIVYLASQKCLAFLNLIWWPLTRVM